MNTLEKMESILREQIALPTLGFYVPDLGLVFRVAREGLLLLVGLALVPGAATAYLIYRFIRKDDGPRALFAVPMVWAAFMYQFSLVLLMVAAYVVFFARNLRSLLEPPLKVVYVAVAACLVFWVLVAAGDPTLPVKRTILAAFDYPHFYRYFLTWFVRGWPVLTIVFYIGSVLLLTRFLADRSAPTPVFVLGAIFVPAVLASFFRSYPEARYTFHLYPLMLIVYAAIAVEWGTRLMKSVRGGGQWRRGVVAVAMVLVAFLASQDANPVDAWSIGNRTYQSAKDPIRSVVNWTFYKGFHQDHKGPSLYVRERLVPGDRVVALGPPHMVSAYHYYIGRVDYAVGGPDDFRYHRRVRGGKTVTYMTGSEILESLPGLKEIIEGGSGGGIWLLGDRMLLVEDNPSYSNKMKEYIRSLARDPNYLGLDGQTFVVKVR